MNCEPDIDSMLAAPTSVAARTNRPVPAVAVTFESDPPPQIMGPSVDRVDENVLTYVARYLAYRAARKHSCVQCVSALTKDTSFATCYRKSLIGLKSFTGETDIDAGSLEVPSEMLFQLVVRVVAHEVFETQAENALCGIGVLRGLRACIEASSAHASVCEKPCEENALREVVDVFLRMQPHRLCAKVTTKAGKGVNKKNRKHVKVSSRVKCGFQPYPVSLDSNW